MNKARLIAVVAAGAMAVTGLAACGGSSGGGGNKSSGGNGATATFNAAVGKVYAPSSTKGGTLHYAHGSDWDSLDPADTYYGYSWNFIRNYGRSLTVFKDSRVQVTEVGSKLGADGFTLTAAGRLRDA